MMQQTSATERAIVKLLSGTAAVLLIFALLAEPDLATLLEGFLLIQISETGNITDTFVTGGVGSALLNAALVLLTSMGTIRWLKLPFSGQSVACLYMMAGFALMGKNLINTLPIVLGGFLYALYRREPFSKYIYITFFGTCLSPLVSFVMVNGLPGIRWGAMILCGVIIGFLIPAVSAFTVRIHQGYNLYNVGFAAGFLGLAIASILKGVGIELRDSSSWSQNNGFLPDLMIWILIVSVFLSGIYLGCRSPRQYKELWRHSGRAVSDFILLDGPGTAFVNMALTGALGVLYLYALGVSLNGPLLCCILSLMGFAVFGKHPKNVAPVMLGAITSSLLMQKVALTSPGVLLATFLCTGLAPIAGHFGSHWGFFVGFIHMAIVQNTSFLHGGMNLYNNGFAAGLTCTLMLPIIETFHQDQEE